MGTLPRTVWKRADLVTEDLGSQVRLRPRLLPASLAPVSTLAKDRPEWTILNALAHPCSADDLSAAYPGVSVAAVLNALHRLGLIFPAAQDEAAYFVDWVARTLLREVEAVAHDLAGFGGAALDARRGPLAHGVAADLDSIGAGLARLRGSLRRERPAYVADQLSKLNIPNDLRLNLGCGGTPLPGWINIDVRGGDLNLNLRWGLPFRDGEARFVYAAFVLEHFHRREAAAFLAEIRRVLRQDGALRLVVPDIGAHIAAYIANDVNALKRHPSAPPRTRLQHFLAYAGADARPEDVFGHKYGYDFETLDADLRAAGFRGVERSAFGISRHEGLAEGDHGNRTGLALDRRMHALFVEATPAPGGIG